MPTASPASGGNNYCIGRGKADKKLKMPRFKGLPIPALKNATALHPLTAITETLEGFSDGKPLEADAFGRGMVKHIAQRRSPDETVEHGAVPNPRLYCRPACYREKRIGVFVPLPDAFKHRSCEEPLANRPPHADRPIRPDG